MGEKGKREKRKKEKETKKKTAFATMNGNALDFGSHLDDRVLIIVLLLRRPRKQY